MRRRVERLLRSQERRIFAFTAGRYAPYDHGVILPWWHGAIRNKRWRVVMAIRGLLGWELGGFREENDAESR